MPRAIFGPFQIDKGRTRDHDVCHTVQAERGASSGSPSCVATCTTRCTWKRLARDGEGRRTAARTDADYLEWRHSRFRNERSCPVVSHASSRGRHADRVGLGDPRPGSRDTCSGAETSSSSGMLEPLYAMSLVSKPCHGSLMRRSTGHTPAPAGRDRGDLSRTSGSLSRSVAARCGGAKSRGPQVADWISVAARLASCDCSRRQQLAVCLSQAQ